MKRAHDLKLATLTLVMIPVIALTGALRGPSADLREAQAAGLESETIQSPQAVPLADEPRQSTKPSGVTSEDIETMQISPVSFGDVQRAPVTGPAAETVQSPQIAAMALEAQKNTESPRVTVKDSRDSPALTSSTVVEPLPPVEPNAHMGICNVVDPTNPYDPNAPTRYTEAKDAGATLTRWTLYWGTVQSEGYAKYDAAVKQDLNNGLEVLIVLLNPPHPPDDLEAWASFVSETVNRYMPEGELSKGDPDWPQGKGVRYWQIWNEQNYSRFWEGTKEQYIELFVKSYQEAKAADPDCIVLTGGFTANELDDWLDDLLEAISLLEETPSFDALDAIAVHPYNDVADTYRDVRKTRRKLNQYGFTDKRIWITESGVSVWNDIQPSSVFTFTKKNMMKLMHSATITEAAAYVIQNYTYDLFSTRGGEKTDTGKAIGEGVVEKHLHFMLHDDWGNGCNEPEALGLLRNFGDAVCHKPDEPELYGTPRPSYVAYQLVADHLRGVEPLWRAPIKNGNIERQRKNFEEIAFYRESTQEMVRVLWCTNDRDDCKVTVGAAPPASLEATLINQEGETETITAYECGKRSTTGYCYDINLERTRCYVSDGVPEDKPPQLDLNWTTWMVTIGGKPLFLIEEGVKEPIDIYPINAVVPVVPTIAPSPTPTPTPTPGPTQEPEPDWYRWLRNLIAKLYLPQDSNAFYAAFAVRDEGNGFKEVWVEDEWTAQKTYYTPEDTTGSSVAMASGGMLLKPLGDPDPMTTLYAGEDGWYYGFIAVLKPGDEIDKIVGAVDRDGNSNEKPLRFSYSTPGGDHPDDNLSAASAQAAGYSLPAGARTEPRVAVLGSGFDWATARFVEQAGEPVEWVDTEFDPALAEDYPVLVIPSGGLYGLDNSPSFRARLEEYARRGGVIVAFAQQHGYEFAALPTPHSPRP